MRGNQTKTLKLVKFQELPPFTSFPHMSSPLILLLPPAHANQAHFKKIQEFTKARELFARNWAPVPFFAFDIKCLGEFFSADPITRAFFSCGISRKEREGGTVCARRKKGIKCGKPEEGKQIIPPEKAGGGRGCRIYIGRVRCVLVRVCAEHSKFPLQTGQTRHVFSPIRNKFVWQHF